MPCCPTDIRARLAAHSEATYLAAIAYELGRQTPATQQPVRAGVQERAYSMFPHLTTMLLARYTGHSDMLRALLHVQFIVVEVLLCLTFFCIARQLTASAVAGYFALSLIYIFAIPLPRLMRGDMGYFYFTWHPQATSSLEPAIYCTPQMYSALPVVSLAPCCSCCNFRCKSLCQRAAGTLAVFAGLTTAVLLRFRVQSFLVFFPGLLLLFAIGCFGTRQHGRAPGRRPPGDTGRWNSNTGNAVVVVPSRHRSPGDRR